MGVKEPIHCIQVDEAKYLIGKNVLYSMHRETLGNYGKLYGFCKDTGKFIVIPEHNKKIMIRANWIVVYE